MKIEITIDELNEELSMSETEFHVDAHNVVNWLEKEPEFANYLSEVFEIHITHKNVTLMSYTKLSQIYQVLNIIRLERAADHGPLCEMLYSNTGGNELRDFDFFICTLSDMITEN